MIGNKLILAAAAALALQFAGCAGPTDPQVTRPPEGKDVVVAYYMHRSIRCISCTAIENKSHGIITSQFQKELDSGRLEWRTLNYDDRPDLRDRYGLKTSSLVLVSYQGGREQSHEVLGDLWDLKWQSKAFDTRVSEAVRASLEPKH